MLIEIRIGPRKRKLANFILKVKDRYEINPSVGMNGVNR